MNGDGSLSENPGRWNARANVLFIESPPGVGFSYIKGASPPYPYNDTSTTADSLAALIDFFSAFPSFSANDLWLSGESYGGIYVPWLASAIIASPLAPKLKGILVGNGALKTADAYEGGLTQQRMQFAFNHALFSPALKAQIDAACLNWTAPRAPACDALLDQMSAEMGPLNGYNIEVTCMGVDAMQPQQRALLQSSGGQLSKAALGGNPCTYADTALTAYMNLPAVQAALHVGSGGAAWAECGGVDYTRLPCDEMTEIYPGLLEKIDVLIYNGDQDK